MKMTRHQRIPLADQITADVDEAHIGRRDRHIVADYDVAVDFAEPSEARNPARRITLTEEIALDDDIGPLKTVCPAANA